MPSIPKVFYRVTKNKKPRHQFYVPGFNPSNSCWLAGDWVTVPSEEWESRKDAHQAMFEGILDRTKKQHHRDGETSLEAMTEAQRMAWEHFSGQVSLYVRFPGGGVGPVGVNMGGNRPHPDQVKWMREQGMKIIRHTKNSEVTDTLAGLDFPADLIGDDKEPVDPWEFIIEQNRARERGIFDEMLEVGEAVPGAGLFDSGFNAFAGQMAVHALVEKEKEIIRTEWMSQRGKHDPYNDLDREVREYREMRAMCEAKFGENFASLYERQRASHNECARANLGDTGVLSAFVLPKFNADGTHEPWGPRDVPWGDES